MVEKPNVKEHIKNWNNKAIACIILSVEGYRFSVMAYVEKESDFT